MLLGKASGVYRVGEHDVYIYTIICADTRKTEQEYVAEQMEVCGVRVIRISGGGKGGSRCDAGIIKEQIPRRTHRKRNCSR